MVAQRFQSLQLQDFRSIGQRQQSTSAGRQQSGSILRKGGRDARNNHPFRTSRQSRKSGAFALRTTARIPPVGSGRAHGAGDRALHCRQSATQHRGEEPLELTADERIIEARNEFRGTRIGYGEGALWKNGNWKLVRNLWKPSWGESYQSIAHRVQAFALEKVGEHPGEQIIVVSHESPIWSYRHMLETGHPEHNMLLRHTALASITSITYDCDTRKVLSITYVDPAAGVK